MRCRRRVRAVVSIAAAFIVCGFFLSAGPSRADDNDAAQEIEFSGRDLWRNGAFAYGGFLFAPGGFDQDTVSCSSSCFWRTLSLLGRRAWRRRREWRRRHHAVLAGARIKRGNAEMKFFFDPEWQIHRLQPDDPDNRLRGTNAGLRIAGDLWYEPTPTTLIAGDAALSSIATSHSRRVAFGWRVADEIFDGEGFYAGPETQFFGSDGYRQWRFGAHITSLKAETTEWSAAAGFARDSDGRASPMCASICRRGWRIR